MIMAKKERTPVDDIKDFQESLKESKPVLTKTAEEIGEILMQTKVKTLIEKSEREAFQKEKGLTDLEMVAMMAASAVFVPNMAQMTIDRESDITFGELHDYEDKAKVSFIIVRRVNYILHQTMIAVYDLLEDANKLRYTTKMHYLKAESEWTKYEDTRRKQIEKTAWYTLLDHLRITYDFLNPRIEGVYEAIRNYMIRLGWRDIELKGRIEVVFLMHKMAHSTFLAYFKDFKDECGVDFTKIYVDAKMDDMVKHFVAMVKVLGIKVSQDSYGCYDIEGFDANKNQRVQWAWDDFITDVRDDDIMDEAAKKAIELNPHAQEEYKHVLEESEQSQIEASVDKLSGKFKVTKKK